MSSLADVKPINDVSMTSSFVSSYIESVISDNAIMPMSEEKLLTEYQQDTVSNTAASMFPLISYKSAEHLDTTYLKQIGICVFRAYTDNSNSRKVNF